MRKGRLLRVLVASMSTATASAYTPVASSAPVIVRRVLQNDVPHVSIEITYDKPRTLLRPEAEALSKGLGRLAATLSKQQQKKGPSAAAAKAAPVPPIAAEDITLCDAAGNALAPSLPTVDAFAAAEQLRVGQRAFAVLFEPAEVLQLTLPCDPPLVGIPLRAFATTRNCEVRELGWTWEASAPPPRAGEAAGEVVGVVAGEVAGEVVRELADEAAGEAAGEARTLPPPPSSPPSWEVVGREADYCPTVEDVGRTLRVTAHPASPLDRVALAASPVAIAPPRPLLQRRRDALNTASRRSGDHADGGRADGGRAGSGRGGSGRDGTFRVLSYNLLAECYSRHWDEPGGVHSYCAPALTTAPYRMQRLLEEVLAFSADVICLQECDARWYDSLWAPLLEARGYAGFHACKRLHASAHHGARICMQVRGLPRRGRRGHAPV